MKKKNAIVFTYVVGAGAIAFLVMAFYTFGPPDLWTKGFTGKPLPLPIRQSPAPELENYLREFQDRKNEFHKAPTIHHSAFEGVALSRDSFRNLEFVQTYVGKTWGKGQHLYIRKKGQAWQEILIPSHFKMTAVGFIEKDGAIFLLIENWNPWYPFRLKRLGLSLTSPEKRYEYGIYLMNPDTHEFRYQFPGQGVRIAMDRKKFVFERARGLLSELNHELIFVNLDSKSHQTLALLTESDPGSGRSFDCHWSKDSKVLNVQGASLNWGYFQMLYLVEANRLVLVQSRSMAE